MDYVKMYSSQNGSASSETDPNASQPTTPAPSDNTGNTTNNSGTHNTKGVISARSLNVRDEASASGKIVGSYFKGDVVTILETKDGWGRTDKGWIKMEYVNTTGTTTGGSTTTTTTGNNNNTAGNGSTTTVAKGIVNTQELNIRSSGKERRLGPYLQGLDLPEVRLSGRHHRHQVRKGHRHHRRSAHPQRPRHHL